MTRRSLANILSTEERDLLQVWSWYELQRALIDEEQGPVFEAMLAGSGLTTSRYAGKTRDELEADFAYQRDELAQLTKLGMLACTEAALRVDFIARVVNKRKDDVSRRFRKVGKARGVEKIRLEEDILDTWRDVGIAPGIKLAVAEFKGALHLRHWLAHGRYWRPKLGRAAGHDPVDVFDICKELLQAVDLMPAVPAGP
jgi:hypothetical protein